MTYPTPDPLDSSKHLDITKPPVGYQNLKGSVIRETDRALLFEVASHNGIAYPEPYKTIWFPLSQTKSIVRVPDMIGEDVLVISQWMFDVKGL